MTGLPKYLPRLIVIFLVIFTAILNAPTYAEGDDTSDDSQETDYIAEIESHYGVVDDPDVLERVDRIKNQILSVIPEEEKNNIELTVKVLNDDEINAFALPDGHVYFFKGIIDASVTDDMLAGVMAHEFTHVFHKHHSRMGERQLRGMLIGIGAMLATGDAQALMAGQMIAASMVETYGRNAENDADITGTTWVVEAGYDPVGYLELMGILEQESIHTPDPGGNYFTIHPNPDERIANIRANLEAMGIDVPADIYRVHIPIRFYLPLSEDEKNKLGLWEEDLRNRADGGENNSSDTEVNAEEVPVESTDEATADSPQGGTEELTDQLPLSLVTEYQLRRELFKEISIPENVESGVIAVGDEGVFYITADSPDELTRRGEDITSRLGELFWDGLKNWEVSGRSPDSSDPVLIARRRNIVYATIGDADLLGLSQGDVNDRRVSLLQDILYRYYVNRRI
jgi:Zn-dependent protease with chaperone function